MPKTPSPQTLRRLRDDPGAFAEHLLGARLWDHQLKLARDPARIRVVCSGRQAGKSRTLAVLALHEAFKAGGRRVLLVSAGDAASIDLLAEVSQLATTAPSLAGSVVDDQMHLVTLSNGSTIRSVPASTRQVRGKSIDLLILDEAAFIAEEIWTAARFTVIARPGSRVVMASTPWGPPDRFFAQSFRAGQEGAEGHSAHHWPSTVSPMVDQGLLAMFRSTMTESEYQAEVLAQWVSSAGAYFTAEELAAAVALGGEGGSPLLDPGSAYFGSSGRLSVDVGVDWGFAADANALVGVAPVPREMPFYADGRLFVPLVEEHYGMTYETFIERVVAAGSHRDGVAYRSVRAETNGVGQMPSQVLFRLLREQGICRALEGVSTSAQTKMDSFGAIKMLLQQGRLVLPRYPALLRQLQALEFEHLEGGTMRIAVPERRGHDDLAMALSMAIMPVVVEAAAAARPWGRTGYVQSNGYVLWSDDPALVERMDYLRRYSGGRLARDHSEEELLSMAMHSLGFDTAEDRTWR